MAIIFPRPLPDYNLTRGTIRLVDPVASSASHSGAKLNMSQVVDPAWVFEAETMPLWDDERRPWTAWRSSLRGGLRQFIAHDITRNPPLAYPAARTPDDISSGWDGTAIVTSVGLSGELDLGGLPPAYKFRVGDRIGLEEGEARGYYEVVEDAAAAGTEATVTVSPHLHTGIFTNAAVARLWLPVAKFILDWQSWSEETIGGPSQISFTAYQRVM